MICRNVFLRIYKLQEEVFKIEFSQSNEELNYDQPVEIQPGVFWVGYADHEYQLFSNPYLIREEDEAVLLDGGSRPDFSEVMVKILLTGVDPEEICALIYHHYDADLCGSVANLEDIIDNDDLKIISQKYNNYYINYFNAQSPKLCIDEDLDGSWEFRSGRKLEFIHTPYLHTQGNFVTYDAESKILFTSDLFGSYDEDWDLFLEMDEECFECRDTDECPLYDECKFSGFISFHKDLMPSFKALEYSLDKISNLLEEREVKIIAPQHGRLIRGEDKIKRMIDMLYNLQRVGIDRILAGEEI